MGIKRTLLFVSVFCVGQLFAQKQYVVSQKGKGNSPSVYEALAKAKKEIQANGYPNEGIEIVVESGFYKIDRSIVLDKTFSGTAQKPFTIKTAKGAKVNFFGGEILDFSKFTDFNAKLAGFKLSDSDAAKYIKVFDLKKAGISKSDLGSFNKHGYGFEKNPDFDTPAMLWVDGERMHLSRWPNVHEKSPYYDNVNQFKGKFKDVEIEGAVSLIDILDTGMKKPNMWFKNQEFLENGGGTFTVGFDRSASWSYYKKHQEKIWLDGVLSASWEWDYTKVKSIDGRKITMASGANRSLGFFRKVTHFHFENVPEELDEPGEYFIDREKMLLYFYPTTHIKGKTITLATLNDEMISIRGAQNILIDGFTFESGRRHAIYAKSMVVNKKVKKRTQNITIQNATIRNFNQWGVIMENVHRSKVDRCHIYNMGAGGVKLGLEQQSFSLVKENNVVSNCEIHHIAFDQKSQVPGITLAGCGNIARNNEIYNTPHFGIKMKFANDCLAEKNFMHDLPEYHHFDGGALYLAIGSQFYNRGNVIKGNYFKDIATNGAYLDNYTMGNIVYGNVFENVGNSTKGSKNAAVYIHGGGQNLVANNFAVDCPYAYKTGSHIVKASNTTNYLNNWFKDYNNFFKEGSVMYNQYTERYPEMKYFISELASVPTLINKHVSNSTLKAISNKANKKTQLEVYDKNGALAVVNPTEENKDWQAWFKVRYQSTLFKNNAFLILNKSKEPDFTPGVKNFFNIGGRSGVYEFAPYNLKNEGKRLKITNHLFEGNKWLKSLPKETASYTDGHIDFKKTIKVNGIEGFEPIQFEEIGIQ